MEKFISCHLLHCLILKMLPSCFHEFPKSSCLGIRFHSECIPLIKNQFLKKLKKKSEPCSWLIMRYGSVQFSHSVMSDYLWPHESQHARPPCPSPTPGVHSDSRPSSQWCHPASVIPFSSCPQSLPASESFPMSQLFTWGGQSTGVSALVSFFPKKSQGWSASEWTGWISCSPRDSQESSPTPQFKSINSSALSFLLSPTLTSIHDHWKNHSLD